MSTNSLIGGAIGGVIGFFVAGPAGAAAGFAAGAGLGAALTPMQMPGQQGPRLSDLKVQTSTYGAAIPRVYGTVGITGNVIWLEGNRLNEVVTRRKVKAGGKGGSKKTTVTTYTYYATLAIGLCEGPIAGVRRIWAGPNLIYDAASDDLETIIASNQAASNFSIYLGGAGQQPDSRIQADRGVINTPAYRGLAYIAIKDFLLTDYGNAIPAFKVEVVREFGNVAPYLVVDEEVVSDRTPGTSVSADIEAAGYALVTTNSGSKFFLNEYYAGRQVRKSEVVLPSGYTIRTACEGFAYAVCNNGSGATITDTGEEFVYDRGASVTTQKKVVAGPSGAYICYSYNADNYLASFQENDAGVKVKVADIAIDAKGEYLTITKAPDGLYLATVDGSNNITFTEYDANLNEVSATTFNVAISANDIGTISETASGYCYDDAGERFVCIVPRANSADGSVIVTHSSGETEYLNCSVEFSPLNSAISCRGGLISFMTCNGGDNPASTFAVIKFDIESAQTQSLGDIAGMECEAAGLIAGLDVDSADISDQVSGYRVSSLGSIRSALEPLQAAFPFDAYQSGYQIKFRPRGQASSATIDIAELGVDEQLPQARQMDSQLPARLSVGYLDASRNYDANQQFAERINTAAVNDSELELAVVMTASQAAQVSERLLHLAWLERVSFGPFQLPPTYRQLEATDVITIDAGYAQYEVRLTEVSYNADGSLTCSGVPNNVSVYVSDAVSVETPAAGVIGLPGPSIFIPLDIPVVDEAAQDSAGFVGAMTGYTNGWPGAIAVQSTDGGQTWGEIQAFDGKATIGHGRSSLSANSGALIDQAELVVDLISGALESVTEAQMLAGTNWAAYGADGRWEIVRFRDAVLQADGSYAVSGFKRGDKGTEWATGLHQAGDLFIPLDDGDLAAIGMPVESIGAESTWRGVTAGDSVDSASDVPFTYRGVNLRPLSPAYPVSSRNSGGDLALSWTRRSRLSSSWWATGTAAPLGEASEAYEVDILNGYTVVRTIASGTPSITYTAAQQTADFGSPQASIAARIHQLSAVVGRGATLEVIA